MFRIAKLVLGLLALSLLCLAAARAEVGTQGPWERRIVAFSPETPQAERVKIAESAGGKVVRTLELIDALVIEMPSAEVKPAVIRLRKHGAVVRVDDDPRIQWLLEAAPAFADFRLPEPASVIAPFRPFRPAGARQGPPQAEGQEVPWGIGRVNAKAAWGLTRGQGVKVVVIDTGVDYNHPELKDRMAGGWNAINKEKPGDYMDDHGHGTHVSGTIAAADNKEGVVGVAPQVTLYGVKVLDQWGYGTFDDVIAGMQWAVQNKMQVANMSLGASKGNDSLKAAVEAMAKAGVVLVAAAGNSGGAVGFPAGYAGALAIAASDSADKTATFSSRGPEVAFIAPGVDVKSTVPGNAYDTYSGTSMATPHVAGLSALAIASKGLSGLDAVKAALAKAATPLKDVPPEQQGAGMIDAGKLAR